MAFQTLVTGLAIGGIYALMAVGYSLIFSILNFSNFAYGMVIMLASFLGYFAMSGLGLGLGPALLCAMLGAALLSFLNERVAYSSLRRRRAPPLYFMISAMGTSIFLENMVYATIGSRYNAYPELFAVPTLNIFGASIGKMDLFAMVFSVLAISALTFFIHHTRLGIAIRGASYDASMAELNGVSLDWLIGTVFALAGLFAGLSGVFLGIKYMAYPNMGWITNKAYIAAVIGGLGSLPGAVAGGFLLGVLETFVSVYLSSTLRDVFSFSLLILFLVLMPSGLFGKTLEEKV
ncbi:MAG: branched-chain amino acid ABC transporter permease [Clostridiales bacterium]|nr:branched-chain amino acid ABC transporter permease [Clostridiales bacterium]